ncbi:MAG TPA: glycoside hydrolase family protein, partial [Nitrososphaeraceae archaeon]
QAAEAEQHRIEDNFADTVNGYLKVQLTQYQFDALVDLAYNVGTGNFHSSTLLRDINDRTSTPATISDDWRLFHQEQNRQNQEINMFNNGIYPLRRAQQ